MPDRPAWCRMWGLFMYKSDEFLAAYHKRSNVESTFSAIKRKFGGSVRFQEVHGAGERDLVLGSVPQPVVSRDGHARAWDRPDVRSDRGRCVIDLTAAEQANVLVALRHLRVQIGGWKPLADGLGFSRHTLRHVRMAEKAVSPTMAMRVAKLASVGVDDVLRGAYPPVGVCPHCGKATR